LEHSQNSQGAGAIPKVPELAQKPWILGTAWGQKTQKNLNQAEYENSLQNEIGIFSCKVVELAHSSLSAQYLAPHLAQGTVNGRPGGEGRRKRRKEREKKKKACFVQVELCSTVS
jgi:hypothetical protein